MRIEKIRYVSGIIAVITALILVMAYAVHISYAKVENYGYVPIDLEISESEEISNDKGEYAIVRGTLPSSYNSNNKTWFPTYIKEKNQSPYPICYAFSLTSTAEISYSKEKTTQCVQTSPGHFAWYGYNTLTDPLGLTQGDGVKLTGSNTTWNFGGNDIWSVLNLARGIGLAKFNSSTNPMLPTSTSYSYTSGAYSNIGLSLENADIIEKLSDETDASYRERIKQAIYDYGGVNTSMYFDNLAYKSENNAYNYDVSHEVNHGVVIIGWDDNYNKTKFANMPEGNGAWIVQNSWGSNAHNFDKGTFYVSYYDKTLLSLSGWTLDMCESSTYPVKYQYDGGVSSANYKLSKGQWAANIYKVASNQNFSLSAVSFTSYTEGTVTYNIDVYTGVTAGKPTSGTKAATLTGVKTEHAGYHTFKLSSPVDMNPNTQYSIVVRPQSTMQMGLDDAYVGNGFELLSVTSGGQSYLGQDGYNPYDIHSESCCFRIKGLGNTFNVVDLSTASISINAQTYTGSAITPAVNISGLTEGKDFTVAYKNNVNAGTATVTVSPKSLRCKNSKTVSFTINPANISNADSSVTPNSYTYDETINPVATVKFGGKTLVKDTDYTVQYTPNDSYTGTDNGVRYKGDKFLITGKGNYTGTKQLIIKHYQANINSAEATLPVDYVLYTGGEIRLNPIVTYKGKTLTKDTDYQVTWENNKAVGKATIKITGKTDFYGTKTINFNIKYDVTKATVIGGVGNVYYKYEANEIKPEIKLSWEGKYLTQGTDFTVKYSDNKDPGTAKVEITGIGNYGGTIYESFIIREKPISMVDRSMVGPFTYTGAEIKPDVKLTNNGVKLVKDTDYKLEYKNNVNAGTMTIKITGIGKYYTGESSFDCSISKVDLSYPELYGVTAKLTKESYKYTGNDIKPSPVVTYNKMTLKEGTDYKLEYSNNKKPGTAKVKIIGLDKNYTGNIELTYEIEKAPISDAKAVLSAASYKYTGEEKKPVPTLTYNGINLVEGVDYTVSYENNTNAGTASVVIEGMGNFTGTKTVSFAIKPLSITKMTLSASSFIYDGKYKYPKVTVYQGSKILASSVTGSTSDIKLTMSLKNKTPGTYTVKVSGTGNYTGTLSLKYVISVKGVSVTSLTAKSKGFAVKCSKLSSTYVTGYQVRYSTSSKMSSAKTVTIGTKSSAVSKTVSKLKSGKKYYVQVRSYKTINGKKYYSGWSTIKSVKTK